MYYKYLDHIKCYYVMQGIRLFDLLPMLFYRLSDLDNRLSLLAIN